MGNFLVDTHCLLWAKGSPSRLSGPAREAIGQRDHRVFVSSGALWELSIKITVGKLQLPETFFQQLNEDGYELLGITPAHLAACRQLPLLHRDPFDRLLVAQAQSEDLVLITNDPEIRRYEVSTLW